LKVDLAIKISSIGEARRPSEPGKPHVIRVLRPGYGMMLTRLGMADGSVPVYFEFDERFLDFALPPTAYQVTDWIAVEPIDAVGALGRLV
jgi:hypothetical protein